MDLISGFDQPSIVSTGNGDEIAIKSLPLMRLAITAPPPVYPIGNSPARIAELMSGYPPMNTGKMS